MTDRLVSVLIWAAILSLGGAVAVWAVARALVALFCVDSLGEAYWER